MNILYKFWIFNVQDGDLCCAVLFSHVLILCDPMGCSLPGSSVHGNFPDEKFQAWVAMSSFGGGAWVFPIQGWKPGLLHCTWILYPLSHKGSPRILEWVAIPSAGDLTDPEIKLGSPTLQVDSILAELPGSDGKEYACNTGDLGSIPGLGRYLAGGHGNLLQILARRIPMDRETYQSTVHGVSKSQT